MGVTIRQIAEAAGVSRGTVDRALNNRGRIRPEVAERVRQIAEEMGYKPNQLGRALSMSRNNIKIGVILQGAETPFMKEVMKGVEEARAEVDNLGGTVLIHTIEHQSAEDVLFAMEKMRQEEVSGIAMVPLEAEEVKKEIDRFVEEYHIPVVTFTSDVEDTKRLCFVGQNGVQCGRAAAGLMGELTGGKGKVAIISGYRTNTSLSSRVSGFRSEMRKKYPGIEIIGPEYCFEENVRAREVAEKIFKEVPDLAGIYLTSHGEEGVCRAIAEAGKMGLVKQAANRKIQRNREKAMAMNKGFVLFLTAVSIAVLFTCINYLQVKSEITASMKNVANLESELAQLKEDNDAYYSQVTSDVDISAIKKKAIGELGMKYPSEDQIQTYVTEGNSYVRQYQDVDTHK